MKRTYIESFGEDNELKKMLSYLDLNNHLNNNKDD